MAENTKIEWASHTINMWWGCSKVSPGCKLCYADTFAKRFGKDIWGPGKAREDHRKNAIKTAMKLEREAKAAFDAYEHWEIAGAGFPWLNPIPSRPRVFSASMSDWLDDEVPIEWLVDLLELIRVTPNLDWLLLSKRPQNWWTRIDAVWAYADQKNDEALMEFCASWMPISNFGRETPPSNVWIGTTVEDQTRADERIPQLLAIPAKVRFLSCEPLLGQVTLYDENTSDEKDPTSNGRDCKRPCINWVICGGESGPGCRPMDIEWARSLRDQCKAASVPYFMKQLGGVRDHRGNLEDLPEDLRIREFPKI